MSPQVKYSICMCNYNMADTIECSIRSILDQLDDDFEVVVVDDGSSDASLRILSGLQNEYPGLRVIALPRDQGRRLGYTRNESIRAARGEYVLLHLDCDDFYGPHLIDFTKAFHQIESAFGRDILLSGRHINMARRSFLLNFGPYRNIFRGEDRDLWMRLAAVGAYVPFSHVDFVTRLPKVKKDRYWRPIINTYDHLFNDFRSSATIGHFFRYELMKWPGMSLKQKVLRTFCMMPAYVMSWFAEPLPPAVGMEKPEYFMAYRAKMYGTLEQILARHDRVPNWTEFTLGGQKVFAHGSI